MSALLRRLLPLLLLVLLPAAAQAQRFGTVAGTVSDAGTGEALPGASVMVEGTAGAGGPRGVAAAQDGTYRLARLEPGTYRVTASYIGYAPQTATVRVEAGGTTRQDYALEVRPYQGQGVTVLGIRAQGQAKALTQQRNAVNITSIVSSNQIGRFPDASAPEALQRVPGIGVQRDQGEGRFVQIRGAAPQFTTVTFNGERIPSPEGDVRQIALDAVPTEILESIEVSKAITPDMDADAIGGSVNLVTQRAPAATLLGAEVAGGYGTLRDEGSFKGTLTGGTRLAAGRLGLLANATLNRRNFGSDNIEPAYDFGDDGAPLGGDDALEELEVRYYDVMRQRLGLNTALDYQFSDRSHVTLRGIFSQLQDTEERRRVLHVVEDEELGFAHKNRTEYLRTYHLGLTGHHGTRSGIEVDYRLTYARSTEDTPEDVEVEFVQEGVAFAPAIDDRDAIRPNPQGDALANGTFLFDAVEPAESFTSNTDYVAALDLALPYRLGDAFGRLQFGGKYRYKDKDQDVTETAWELADGADDLELGALGRPASDFFDDDFEPGDYPLPVRVTDGDQVLDFIDRYRSVLEQDDSAALEGDLEDFEATEQTFAGYVMTRLDLTPRLLLLPGLRYERTDLESVGYTSVVETEIEDGDVSTDLVGVARQEGSNDYGYLFPMLHARYRVTDNTNLRGAVTTALARPNFFDLAPYRIQDDDEVELGNPALDPSRSLNLDLSVEHYNVQLIGLVSAGAFYKRIDAPIVTFRTEAVEQGAGLELIQSRNGEEGTIWGLELAVQQQLRFLPGVLSGLGLYANYTYTDSEVTLQDGTTNVFPGQADHLFNAALSYERGGFSGQVSLNYTGRFLDEFGGDAVTAARATDIYVEERYGLDASATYRLPGGVALYAEVLNLLNEPLALYQGDQARPIQREFYRRWGWIGVKYTY